MEYYSLSKTLFATCDDYSSLVVRHAQCGRFCNLPWDGVECPCLTPGLTVEKQMKICLYDGVTKDHASKSVAMEHDWCAARRAYRDWVQLETLASHVSYVNAPSVVFLD